MARNAKTPTWDEFAKQVGVRLLVARQAKGLTQEQVASAAGIAGYTYQKFEKGESKPGRPLNPQLMTLIALSQVLEVGLMEIVPFPFPDATAGRS